MKLTDMNKLILYSVIIFIIGISCDKDEITTKQADKFVKYYGGLAVDHGNDVKQLPGGGYFIIGTITVGDNTDIFTLVTDKYGNSTADIKPFDGTNLNDKVSRMQLLPDGGAIAVGTYQRALGNNDIWILRFNSRGDTVWTRKYGRSNDDEGYHLIINQADEIIVVGYSDSLSSGGVLNKQIWMHAVSLDGNNIWPNERRHGDISLDEVANSIVEVNDGYVLVGSRNPKNSTRNILLLKTNKFGIVRLFSELRSNDDDQGIMLTSLSNGNFLVLGTRTNISTNTSDILLSKIDASFGMVEPMKILDNNENESASCFIYKNNQIHILGTTIEARTDTRKILLIIANESGTNPKYFKFGLKNITMEGFGMDYTSDGGYVFTGSNLVLYKIKDSGEL